MYCINDNIRRENISCECPCHLHCSCINENFPNKSEIISNINVQNPNSEYYSYNYDYKTPLYSQNEIYNYTYSPKLDNNCNSRNIRLMERSKSFKGNKSSNYCQKSRNNEKKRDIYGNSFINNLDNFSVFHGNKSCFNNSCFNQNKDYLKCKLKNINKENYYLSELLSKVPKHEKNPYRTQGYMKKLKRCFSNCKFNRRPNEQKYERYSSIIMPANDL